MKLLTERKIKMKLEINNINISINGRKIIDNVSADINSGEMVAITGPSGSGKTTLLNCLGLTQPIDSGSILIDNKDISKSSEKEKNMFWKKYSSFIYQDYGIIEEETVAYNVVLNSKYKKQKKEVSNILKEVGLSNRDYERAIVLSGGEKQRVGIARAIYKNAKIIFADEPTASLDDNNREQIINLLHQQAEKGSIVIISTHDSRLVSACDKIIALNNAGR